MQRTLDREDVSRRLIDLSEETLAHFVNLIAVSFTSSEFVLEKQDEEEGQEERERGSQITTRRISSKTNWADFEF